ncbi:MAG: alpha/beta hydrolase [Patescibacteria group bacterium]
MYKYLNTKYFLIPFSLFLLFLGFYWFNNFSYSKANPGYLTIASTRELVASLEDEQSYILKPKNNSPKATMIFLSGGLVEEKSYLYNMSFLVENYQIQIIIPKIKYKLAFFDQEAIDRTVKNYNLKRYFVGGHSLGGVVACYHTKNNPKTLGLILMASYCDESISQYKGQVLQVTSTNDKVIDQQKLESKSTNLPDNYKTYFINGGNHAQFGTYGQQRGDGESSLTVEDFLSELSMAFLEFNWDVQVTTE